MSRLWTPQSYGTTNPPERIFGFETEHDIRDGGGTEVTNWEKEMFAPETLAAAGLKVWSAGAGYHWLSNGAYMYKEVGAHSEYATPECLGSKQATLAMHAGNAVLADLVSSSEAPYQIFRRSATVDPVTGRIKGKGFHVNACIPNIIANPALLAPVETLWATQLFAWGGIVTKHGFNISPKAMDIGGHITSSTHTRTSEGKKPFGLVRAKGLNDDSDTNDPIHGFGRLEDRSKTPSNPWSDFMGAATTSIMLRIIEHPELTGLNRRLRGLTLANSVETFRQASWDMGMQKVYAMRDGRRLSALDIQEKMMLLGKTLRKFVQLPEEELLALQEWERIVTDLRRIQKGEADLKLVARHIGWAGKYVYLSSKLGEDAIRTGDPRALRYCLNWDRIAPKGAGQVFDERRGNGFGNETEYKPLKTQAPEGTRASVRAEYIEQHEAGAVELDCVRWPFIKIRTGKSIKTIRLHPYQTKTPATV